MSSGDLIPVTFYGQSWQIRNPGAHEWLMAVRSDPEHLSRVFPGLVRLKDVDRMLTIEDTPEELERRWRNTARKALERASGRHWWRAVNHINKALEMWTVLNGSLTLAGVDARTAKLDAWLDAAYVQMMRTMDDNERKQLEFALNRPPRNSGIKITASRASLAAFAAD